MKNKWLYIVLVLAFIGVIYSLYYIVCWVIDNKNTATQIQMIQEFVKDSNNDKNDYNSEIDFDSLKRKNKEVKGWIKVPNTNVNYPFVQYKNNNYYLTHSFDNRYNSAGWIFLDYRNNIDDLSTNTVIYGHGRVDGTMFGSLKNILTKEWFNNSDNYIITIYTERKLYNFEIFSAYHVVTTEDYLNTEFNSVEEINKFLKLIRNRSVFTFPAKVTENDKILTLSTCYNDREKMVVHAKLVEEKNRI